MKIIKIIGIALAALVGLMLTAIAVLLFVVDPNDYKPQISALVYEASGYHLTLSGDLSWSFYPVLGFASEGVTLSADKDEKAFVELAGLSVGVQLVPLFSKQLKVDSLNLSGLKANLQIDQQGVQNWQPLSVSKEEAPAAGNTPEEKVDDTASALENPVLADLEIPVIRLQDSDIRYQDLQAGGNYAVHIKLLQLENVRLDRPFDLTMQLTADAGDGLVVQLDGTSQVALDLNQSRYSLSNLKLALEVAGIAAKPLPLQLEADAVVDLSADTAQLSVAKLKLEEQVVQAQIQVAQLQTAPAFSGRIQMPPSNIKPLLAKLAIELPDMASATALSKVGLDATLKGTPQAVTIQPLSLTLDDSKLTGMLALDDIEKQALRFDLLLDKINLDQYLPPVQDAEGKSTTPPAVANTAATGSEELIPVELIRTLNLSGQLRVTQLQVQQIPLSNVLVKVDAKSGVLRIAPMSLEAFSGKIAGNVVVNAKEKTPDLSADLKVDNIETAGVVKHFADLDVLSGRASLSLNAKAQGNDLDVLMRDAIGQLKLQLNDGVLHGININNLVVDALSEQIADLERLYPDYKKYVPRELKQDTDINALIADAKIENGKLIMPNFNFAIDNGAIDASGNFDLINLGFDYQMGVYLKAMDQVKYLKGVKWPVQCKGSMESAPADWCRPDTTQIKKVVSNATKSAFKDEAAKELGDKIGVDVESKQQLENEAKARAKEEEDRAKQKLEDKLNKFLKKL